MRLTKYTHACVRLDDGDRHLVIDPGSFSPDGELATARAAKKAGSIYVMSTAATIAMEDVAPEAGTWWFQLYTYSDRGITRDLVQRAAATGATASS